MRYFTNSPYERMMMQVPRKRREEQPPAVLLPDHHRCFGCASYMNGCVGVCCRELIITPKRKESEKCDL